MASTNKTTNYELSQFIETDRPAWLTDYNGDMRTIDRTMKAISDVANDASGSISELADRMSTAEGNINTNTNDISTLDARADALEAQAQSTAGTIANIQTEQTAQNLGIEAATELGYNLARPYDSASTYAVGAYVLFQNTLYKCITAVPVGEAFDATKWLAIKATDEIAGNNIQYISISDYSAAQKIFSIDSISGGKFARLDTGSTSISDIITITNPVYGSTTGTLIIKDDLYILKLETTISFDPVTLSNVPCIMKLDGRFTVNANSSMYQYIQHFGYTQSLREDHLYTGGGINATNSGRFSDNKTQYNYYEIPRFLFSSNGGTISNFIFSSFVIGQYN